MRVRARARVCVYSQFDEHCVGEVRMVMEVAWHSSSDIQLTVKALPGALHR